MRMCLPSVLALILGGTAAAHADSSFATSRREVIERMRPAIDRAGLASGDLLGRCGKPLNLKTCRYPLASGIEMQIVETYSKRVPMSRFMDGADGEIYEVAVLRQPDRQASSNIAAFEALCASAIQALRPETRMDAARALVERLIQKARKRADDPAQARQSDRRSTVIIDLSPDVLDRCRVTAEDDYLPASGLYKAGEDVP